MPLYRILEWTPLEEKEHRGGFYNIYAGWGGASGVQKYFGATKVFDHPPTTPSTPPLPPSTPKFLPNLLKYPISAAGTVWNRFPVSENPRGQILSPIRWNGDEIEGWPKL